MVPASGMSREGASPHATMNIRKSMIDARIPLSFGLPYAHEVEHRIEILFVTPSDVLDAQRWIETQQVLGVRRENGPPSLASKKHHVSIDGVDGARRSEHSAKHSRHAVREINHACVPKEIRDGDLPMPTSSPHLRDDPCRRHQRYLRGREPLHQRNHRPVTPLSGDERPCVEHDARGRRQAAPRLREAAFRLREGLTKRLKRASARRVSSGDGFTSRTNAAHACSSSASSRRSSITSVTQADTVALPAAFLMRTATRSGTLMVIRLMDITSA